MILAAIAAALVIGFMLGRSGTREPVPKYKILAPGKKTIAPKTAEPKTAPAKTAVTAAIGVKKQELPRITKKFKNPRVAIVIDDFGYNTNNLERFLDIGEPITLSILPNQRYSIKVAEIAHSRGYETMLHLPLEAKDRSAGEEPGTIRSSMSDAQIVSRLKEELASVPYVEGVSNHMGSKGTEEVHLMSVIFGELKNRKLFFFDSLTSSNSVCGNVARSSGLRYARRDVFLDIPGGQDDIEKRLLETRRLAFKKGCAIAVGHDRRNTVTVLERLMPEMADEGVEFVYISDLAK